MNANQNQGSIQIQGARVHNLKNVDCAFPHGSYCVVTGVSGSGKSSLAFNTLFAEGQRRYIECLSAYTRQFLQKMARPDVDAIQNILPAIAIEQRNKIKNARSTVGTVTEINDYLRLLFAKVGQVFCPDCGIRVEKDRPEVVMDALFQKALAERVLFVFPFAGKKEPEDIDLLRRDGFRRALVKGPKKTSEVLLLDDEKVLSKKWLGVVVDRLKIDEKYRTRIREAIELAYIKGQGEIIIVVLQEDGSKTFLDFSENLQCKACKRLFPELRPQQFSFNSPLGACPDCEGFGRIVGVDFDRVIPDHRKSIKEGAINPFTKPAFQRNQRDLLEACKQYKIPLTKPWKDLTEGQKQIVIEGKGKGRGKWYGVDGFFNWLDRKKYKMHVRVFLSRYRGYTPCQACKGTRLKPEVRCVQIAQKNIAELCDMPVDALLTWFSSIPWTEEERTIAKSVLYDLGSRLSFLNEVGLSYLTLARQARSLSGGESQRISLASALGSKLTETLYVLDEPSIGLHARDNERLLNVIMELRDVGNTIVIVEHDQDFIAKADTIFDLGPKAGHLGGELVFSGTYAELLKDRKSLTAQYLNKKKTDDVKKKRRSAQKYIKIRGAKIHNITNLDVDIPLQVMTVVTGVSGAGKSSLVHHVLYAAYEKSHGRTVDLDPGVFRSIKGLEHIEEMVMMDQNPLGRSIRSNVASYIDAFSPVRKIFASLSDARQQGLKPGAFSFNTAGGRCEVCQGLGYLVIEMQFLEDVEVPCEECKGKRFKNNVLSVRYREKNIDDILQLTILQAMQFFSDRADILRKLQVLFDVGLGYLKLGQSTSTLSGGEAQRLKLAAHMALKGSRQRFYIFDEPTTGLHPSDIQTLLQTFDALLELGHSILVIEHNLGFMARADHIIDLGPGGGIYGGKLVTSGTPEEVILCQESYTGQYLKRDHQNR